MVEYNKVMEQYTKGTGGGAGDDVNYVVWQKRDPANVSRYMEQGAVLYLTIVHIWDMNRGFQFIVSKDPLPDDCQIEDGNQKIPSGASTLSPYKSKTGQVVDVLNKLDEATSAQKLRHDEMLSIMREEDGEDADRKASKQHQYVNLIAETNKQVIQFKSQVNDAKRKKNEHEKHRSGDENGTETKRKKNRIKVLKTEIENGKGMVNTLTTIMMHYQKELAGVNAMYKEADSDGSDSSILSDSD